MSPTRSQSIYTTAIIAMLSTACDGDEGSDPAAPEAVVSDDSESPTNMLATPVLEVEHGVYTLTFLETDNGIAVVEYAPADAPPLLDALVVQDASAAEVLRALAPDADPDAALLVQEISAAVDGNAGPIRQLTAGTDPVANGEVFEPPLYYATNCSFAADGPDYFDGWWQALDWDWHWYQYTTPNSNIQHTSATTPARKKLRAHTCNNGGSSDEYNWGVYRTGSAGCTAATVYVRGVEDGYRAVYYQTGASDSCAYWTYAINSVDEVPHSLGIMAP